MGKLSKFFLTFIALSVASLGLAFSLQNPQTLKLQLPPFSRVEGGNIRVQCDAVKGHYEFSGLETLSYPFPLRVWGPLGGVVETLISSSKDLQGLNIATGLVLDSEPRPQTLALLPEICPRVHMRAPQMNSQDPKWCNGGPPHQSPHSKELRWIYRGKQDRLNHRPTFQALDPDFTSGKQNLTLSHFDGKNALMVERAQISNDYEDNFRIDYRGPHPQNGKEIVVHEGTGGFYSNIHYAVVPYDPKIQQMDHQTLMALVHGDLIRRGKPELRPELRTHSFLPGPFSSKKKMMYHLCEWGDTQFQSPVQTLEYDQLALWDWDYPVKNADHVLLIFWEEDEEHNNPEVGLLPKFYSRDDLIGIFEIKRSDTLQSLTLKNPSGDFEITLRTGDL